MITKRPVGRPSFTDTPGKRLQVHLPPKTEAFLRSHGGQKRSLSIGIIKAARALEALK